MLFQTKLSNHRTDFTCGSSMRENSLNQPSETYLRDVTHGPQMTDPC